MIDNIKEYTAKELRKLRAEKNESLEVLSRNVKIGKDTLSRYENGKYNMNLDIIQKLLEYYNVSFDIFFAPSYTNKHNSNKEIEVE